MGRPGEDPGAAVGGLSVAETVGPAALGRWLRSFADAVDGAADELTALDDVGGHDAIRGRDDPALFPQTQRRLALGAPRPILQRGERVEHLHERHPPTRAQSQADHAR